MTTFSTICVKYSNLPSGVLVRVQPNDAQTTKEPSDVVTTPSKEIQTGNQPTQVRSGDDVRTDLPLKWRRDLSDINVQIDEDHLNLIKSDDEIVVASINTIKTFSNITYDRSYTIDIVETIFQNMWIRNVSGTL